MREIKNIILSLLLTSVALVAWSINPHHLWLQVEYIDDYGILRMYTHPIDSMDDVSHLQIYDYPDTLYPEQYLKLSPKIGRPTMLELEFTKAINVGVNIPTLHIDIENGAEVANKVDYQKARIWLEGYDVCPDFAPTDVEIRGRGNSTWNYSKKPYRLKFAKKWPLGGLKKSKDFVLLANYIDCTLMRNAIAMKAAQLLEIPFTNHIIPVNLEVNGTYRGSYNLTEKIGIDAASVDIDSETGLLLELDSNYDEKYKFKSQRYNLPVMVRDPYLSDIIPDDRKAHLRDSILNDIQDDFEQMELSIGTDSIDRYLDLRSAVDYLLLYSVVYNREICHPKSFFLYKEHFWPEEDEELPSESSKYCFGPVWDFDWAYTYAGKEVTYTQTSYLLQNGESLPGAMFFIDLLRTPGFMQLFEERWCYFYETLWPQLMDYFDDYAAKIRPSGFQNGERWPQHLVIRNVKSSELIDDNIYALRKWMQNRVRFMSVAPNHGLYDPIYDLDESDDGK